MNRDVLEAFGKLLIERVRDYTIAQWEGTLDGRAMNERARAIRAALGGLEPDQRDAILRLLMPQIVDTTIHYFLWMLEQEETIDVPALREASDGLSAELYDWIRQYSKKPYTEW